MPVEKVGPLRLHLSTQRPDLALGTLPETDVTLAQVALEIVELSAWLLATCEARLLCLKLTPPEQPGRHSVMPWGRTLDLDIDLGRLLYLPDYPHRSVVAKLDRAAGALFAILQDRWPAYARPSRLGAITDGTGIGFSVDDPWPLRAGWLAHQVFETRLTAILPFHPQGAWSMLTHTGRSC